MLFGREHTTDLCESCRSMADMLRRETLMPVPKLAPPLSHTLKDRAGKPMPLCYDCAAAEGLHANALRFMDIIDARIVIANDRQEKLRLPGAPMGLPTVLKCQDGDFDRLWEWNDEYVSDDVECLDDDAES